MIRPGKARRPRTQRARASPEVWRAQQGKQQPGSAAGIAKPRCDTLVPVDAHPGRPLPQRPHLPGFTDGGRHLGPHIASDGPVDEVEVEVVQAQGLQCRHVGTHPGGVQHGLLETGRGETPASSSAAIGQPDEQGSNAGSTHLERPDAGLAHAGSGVVGVPAAGAGAGAASGQLPRAALQRAGPTACEFSTVKATNPPTALPRMASNRA